jgi:hypothetical protein
MNESTTTRFGAKGDISLMVGIYSQDVLLTAILNERPVPSITSISPTSGGVGTLITLTGTNFTYDDSNLLYQVLLGTTPNQFVCENLVITNATTATCSTPIPDSTGVKAISGISVYGDSFSSVATYNYNITIVAITPNIASTIAGTEAGPQMTIVGTNLLNLPLDKIQIGGVSCVSLTIVSATQAACEAPTLTAGVQVTSVLNTNQTPVVTYYNDAYPTMQAAIIGSCSTTPTIYRDIRDSQLYYVAKMPDNNCWQIDNLKYAGANTGVGVGNTAAGELFWAGKCAGGNHMTVDCTNSMTPSTNQNVAKYYDPNYYTTSCRNLNNSLSISKCGFLYNWYAATAGTGNSTVITTDATSSICPTGWHLPNGGQLLVGTDIYNLWHALGADVDETVLSINNPSSLFRAPLAGSYNNGSLLPGSGYFWSATGGPSNTSAHGLFFNSVSYSTSRWYGRAMRCLLN